MRKSAFASGVVIGQSAIVGNVLGDSTPSRDPLVDDLTVTNATKQERTFRLTATNTSGKADPIVFEETVTVAGGETRTFETVFPRGKESRLDVELEDGRTASRSATVVGGMPLLYGLEVVAKPDLLAVYPRHIDPGPNEWGDH